MDMAVHETSPYAALREYKSAGTDSVETQVAKNLASRRIWEMIVGGLGVGAVGRGIIGLPWLFRKSYRPEPSAQNVPIFLPKEEDPDEQLAALAEKTADDGGVLGPLFHKDWGSAPLNWFFGKNMTSPWAIPALWTLGFGGLLGGTAAGYKGLDALLHSAHKQELKGELRQTRNQYKQIVNRLLSKQSASRSMEEDLDELADLYMEKKAIPNWIHNVGGFTGGAALTYALLSALLSGKLSYDYFKKRSQRAISEEALRRRSKERFGGMTPISLSPTAKGPV